MEVSSTLRLPKDLDSKVKRTAAKEHRSKNQQIIRMLEDWLTLEGQGVFKLTAPSAQAEQVGAQ